MEKQSSNTIKFKPRGGDADTHLGCSLMTATRRMRSLTGLSGKPRPPPQLIVTRHDAVIPSKEDCRLAIRTSQGTQLNPSLVFLCDFGTTSFQKLAKIFESRLESFSSAKTVFKTPNRSLSGSDTSKST